MSWTINRQGQFKEQKKDEVCVWVYSLFTDVAGDYIKKPMKECTGEEITAEWLYHLGVPVDEIDELAKNHCNTTTYNDAIISQHSSCQEERETDLT